MLGRFNFDDFKEKAKDLANNVKENETVKQGLSAAQEVTENLKDEVLFQVSDKLGDAMDSEVVQNTLQKSSEISKQVIDTGKTTFMNTKKKVKTIASKTMVLTHILDSDEQKDELINLKIKKEKYNFLYVCSNTMQSLDPFNQIVQQAEKIAKQFGGYYGDNIPYGRVLAFNQKFNTNLDTIVFIPEPSKDLQEMKEFGMTINTNCLIVQFQIQNSFNLLGRDINYNEIPNIEECIYFDKIQNVQKIENYLQIEYRDLDNQLKSLKIHDKYKAQHFNNLLMDLLIFASKFSYINQYTNPNFNKYDIDDIDSSVIAQAKKLYLPSGMAQSLSGKLNHNIDSIDYSYHEAKNYPQGSGYYAEYLNAEFLNTAITKVELIAKSNPAQKHGHGDNAADFKMKNRFTGKTEFVQLKYKNSPRQLARDVMEYDTAVMIPPDKYVETMKLLKNDAEFKNKVSNKKLQSVKKGVVPYDLTISLSKSLPKKIGNDVLLSGKQALTPGLVTTGCSALIGIWKGEELEEVMKQSAKQGSTAFLLSTTIGSTAKIAGRISATHMANKSLKNVEVKNLAKISQKTAKNVAKTATVLVIATSVVPDLNAALNGKISNQQLAKTLITTGAGILGAGIGNIPLAILASEGTAQLLDKYVKDDVVTNYQIFKEVFIDLVYRYQLPADEVNMLITQTFANPNFNENLIELQLSCKNYTNAKYMLIYESLQKNIEKLIENRPDISEERWSSLVNAFE